MTTITKPRGLWLLFFEVIIVNVLLCHSLVCSSYMSLICFLLRGHSMEEGTQFAKIPFRYLVPDEGFSLPIVYFVWLSVVIFMYPLCKWDEKYKTNKNGG